MSLRTNLLKNAEKIRHVLRKGMDQCPNKLTIIQRSWSGGRNGAGAATDTVLIDFDRYLPIRQMLDHEVTSSGGKYRRDDLMVSRITPGDDHNPGVGYTPPQLQPQPATNGVQIIYRITSPTTHALDGDYRIIDIRVGGRASHPGGYSGRGGVYSYALILRRLENTP